MDTLEQSELEPRNTPAQRAVGDGVIHKDLENGMLTPTHGEFLPGLHLVTMDTG